MLDALIAPYEPKTGTQGTMGWLVDVANPVTDDDFVLMLKKLEISDGTTWPYSVWVVGNYPRVFERLFKMLSPDMRIADAAWIGVKLRKLMRSQKRRVTVWRAFLESRGLRRSFRPRPTSLG